MTIFSSIIKKIVTNNGNKRNYFLDTRMSRQKVPTLELHWFINEAICSGHLIHHYRKPSLRLSGPKVLDGERAKI